ncbi:enhancer of polycomb-like-domain-containing protein [Abortiporus biennis]|nr:enhancer of polycomb-like-domain-containing protein [Abortiporus biennis]
MPRNHNAGPSTLRNRNRVTNKTRLKVIKEAIDADPIVLDEDEEKARVVSTAGVDAEDANEHHLQAVLHQANVRSTRTEQAAYIPTPDSTGLVDNYAELYPSGRWKDPVTYVKSSDTVEESTSFALDGGYIYYMDERDKEWLDRNNEEARGEGTSAQGAVAGSGSRSSRSAKAKGKDPELSQPVSITEDEFELVMAIFEKLTAEKREFLRHGFNDQALPSFTDFQDTFGVSLSPKLFALYVVPSWVPQSAHLLKLAKIIYPYWRERRLERNGHPIIPVVNLDESDTLNESYICFRRREIKAVRKTRAQQATYSDKMVRLQGELATAMDLARGVLSREKTKKDAIGLTLDVWDKRFALVDLKHKFPSLGTKEDDELFVDREKVKKPRLEASGRIPLKLRTRENGEFSPITQEPMMKPKERHDLIQKQIDQEMAKKKEKDRFWEDAIDNPYQPKQSSYSSQLFKFLSASRASASSNTACSSSSSSSADSFIQRYRAGRLRYGRGGRSHVDRRDLRPRATLPSPDFDSDMDDEERERRRRLAERWKFDEDDVPAVGPKGADEQDRMLVDDYQVAYTRYNLNLLKDQDYHTLTTDATLQLSNSEGKVHPYIPYRLGVPPPVRKEIFMAMQRAPQQIMLNGAPSMSPNAHHTSPPTNPPGTPSTKSMPPPALPPQMRISVNGGMRVAAPMPSNTPVAVPSLPMSQSPPNLPTASLSQQPLNSAPVDQEMKPPVNGINGLQKSAQGDISLSPVDPPQVPTLPTVSPIRQKGQTQAQSTGVPNLPNGYHLQPVNGYQAHVPGNNPYVHARVQPNQLNAQQMQQLKSAFAHMPTNQDGTLQGNGQHAQMRTPASYIPHIQNGPNYTAQLAAARQMQWALAAQAQAQQQRAPAVSVMDTSMDNSLTATLSPPANGTPSRVPSSNGTRGVSVSRGMSSPAVSHSMSPGQARVASPANGHIARLAPHSPSSHLLSPSLTSAQAQGSPTRPPSQTAIPSPSLQSRQIVPSSGAGY